MAIDPNKMAAFVNEGAPPPSDEMEGEEEAAEGAVSYDALKALLVEFAEDVIDVSDDMDPDVLTDEARSELESDDAAILEDGFKQLDRKLQAELGVLKGCSGETGAELAAQLAVESELFADEARIAGWLCRIGDMLGPVEEAEVPAEDGEDAEIPAA